MNCATVIYTVTIAIIYFLQWLLKTGLDWLVQLGIKPSTCLIKILKIDGSTIKREPSHFRFFDQSNF